MWAASQRGGVWARSGRDVAGCDYFDENRLLDLFEGRVSPAASVDKVEPSVASERFGVNGGHAQISHQPGFGRFPPTHGDGILRADWTLAADERFYPLVQLVGWKPLRDVPFKPPVKFQRQGDARVVPLIPSGTWVLSYDDEQYRLYERVQTTLQTMLEQVEQESPARGFRVVITSRVILPAISPHVGNVVRLTKGPNKDLEAVHAKCALRYCHMKRSPETDRDQLIGEK